MIATVDEETLKLCLQSKPKDVPIIDNSYTVFSHIIELSDLPPHIDHEPSLNISIPVEPVILPDGSIDLLCPRIKPHEAASRPKRHKGANGNRHKRKVLATLRECPEQIASDLELASNLKRNSSLTSTNFYTITGPLIFLNSETTKLCLRVTVGLNANVGPLNASRLGTSALAKLLARALNDVTLENPTPYQATPVDLLRVLTRLPNKSLPRPIKAPGLLTPLLPFQRETVQWCLRREGRDLTADGESTTALDRAIKDYVITPPLGWRQLITDDSDGEVKKTLWVNPYSLQTLNSEPKAPQVPEKGDFAGKGLLAEEMGLGKTLEMICLILLNPRQLDTQSSPDDQITTDPLHGHKIHKIKATLVIVPSVILSQWKNELSSHSPHLNVVVYEGRFTDPPIRVPQLSEADVVLVSYTVLSAELHSATFNPGKHNTRFWHLRTDINDVRSPLVQVQFWRVVLDEVQMIHTGVSNAAKVARIVPRVHAWGVTGTPVKTSIKDLRGLLLFLDIEPFVENQCWQRMIASPIDFESTMSRIGIRHTKPLVADQLHLPPQRRMLVSLKFSEIERHHYDTLYSKFKESGRNTGGAWSSWLIRLRQACCHASLVNTGHRDLAAPILTVDQVLAKLVDEAEMVVYAKKRHRMVLQLELGQLLDKGGRLSDAVSLWTNLVKELETDLQELNARLTDYINDAGNRQLLVEKLDDEYQQSLDTESSGSQLLETRLIEAEHALASSQSRVKAVRSRKRSLEELLHRTYFFLGTGYFRTTERLGDDATEQIKAENSAKEAAYYQKADDIRSELLEEAVDRYEQLMKKLQKPRIRLLNASIPNFKLLNSSARFIKEMSGDLLKILSRPLMDTNEVAEDKDAYAESLDDQENAYVLLDMLQIVLKDRSVAIIGGTLVPTPKETGIDPWTDYRRQLVERRQDLIQPMTDFAGVFEPLLSICRRLRLMSQSPAPGLDVADNELNGAMMDSLREEIKNWQRELTTMQDVFNSRLEYYKQLQTLSDRVIDIDTGDSDVKKLTQDKRQAVYRAEKATLHFETKLRYVRDLEVATMPELRSTHDLHQESTGHDGKETDTSLNECAICQDTYDLGSLTVCGHRFCTNCITAWWEIKGTCPLCKRKLGPQDMIQFRNKVRYDVENGTSQPVQRSTTAKDLSTEIYTQIPNSLYNELAREPISRSYGIKIDMIIRHIKLLRSKEPTTQFVIFSQWAQMLKMIHIALNENGLVTASITEGGGSAAFRTNPEISCFLLHAKSDAAGLTLVNANHVILCEPLLNTALELQAISRVHRIGQMEETTVWLFSIEETVEQAILSLTTRRRVRQLDDIREHNLLPEDADSSILANSTGKLVDRASGSEVVPENDLREVLFHQFSIQKEDGQSSAADYKPVPSGARVKIETLSDTAET